jgi:hypothetical protein
MKKNNHFKLYHTDRAINPSCDNWFRIESSFKPTLKDAELAQTQLGYDPKGYGGPYSLEVKVEGVKWVTTWKCMGSCE